MVSGSLGLPLDWWRRRESNPRPHSRQKSVRKLTVQIFDHLVVYADVRRIERTAIATRFVVASVSWSPSDIVNRTAKSGDNALALTW